MFDVLVIGGGNAVLCAAISARREGASVLVLEASRAFWRGGNTRHTRNMRWAHDAATATLSGPYPEEEFFEELMRVTKGKTDKYLAHHMIRQSKSMLGWIEEQEVRWQPSLGGTQSLGRTNSFFLGGGRAMLNAPYRTAKTLGVEIRYEAEVTAMRIEHGAFLSATRAARRLRSAGPGRGDRATRRRPNRDRKWLLAYIIEDVTLVKLPAEGTRRIHVRFKGGKADTLTTQNPKLSAARASPRYAASRRNMRASVKSCVPRCRTGRSRPAACRPG